ncbi:LOW QUALITY PROTEIN: ciliary microtubule inner protein 6 [Cariama cristata]
MIDYRGKDGKDNTRMLMEYLILTMHKNCQQRHYCSQVNIAHVHQWHNNPQPYYARLISSNVRLLNEAICYMGARHQDKTVPLAPPRAPAGLPVILQEQTSFSHWYNARHSANEPIRGKHEAFVCAEIKPASAIVPKGTEMFLSAEGSCSLEQPKTEKGNSVKSRMTSPNLFLQNSEAVGSDHLSKPDVREIAKAYPRIPVRGQKSSSTSQTSGGGSWLPCWGGALYVL